MCDGARSIHPSTPTPRAGPHALLPGSSLDSALPNRARTAVVLFARAVLVLYC